MVFQIELISSLSEFSPEILSFYSRELMSFMMLLQLALIIQKKIFLIFGENYSPVLNHQNSSPNPFSYKETGKSVGWSSPSISNPFCHPPLFFKRGGIPDLVGEGVSFKKKFLYYPSIYLLFH